jgi:hypothetical protein
MDAAKRLKNLKDASWGPPLGGSFAAMRGKEDKTKIKPRPEPMPEELVDEETS